MALDVDADHLEVGRGDLAAAHASGHLGALEDAAGRGARADRAGRAVVLVVTVGRALAREVVALHAAGEALALGHGGGVDHLALLQGVDQDLLADRVAA